MAPENPSKEANKPQIKDPGLFMMQHACFTIYFDIMDEYDDIFVELHAFYLRKFDGKWVQNAPQNPIFVAKAGEFSASAAPSAPPKNKCQKNRSQYKTQNAKIGAKNKCLQVILGSNVCLLGFNFAKLGV